MSPTFDVAVVGAGPGGIAAAAVAAEAGRRVCLLDDNRSPGGQIWRGFQAGQASKYPHGSTFEHWNARLYARGCVVWSGCQVVDAPAAGCLRVEHNGEWVDLRYDRLILATGARERFLPFPGWTLPGVLGVGGLQALVKGGLDVRGKRVVIAGSGPLLLAVGAALARAGAHVLGIHEQANLRQLMGFGSTLLQHPAKIVEGARYRFKTLRTSYRTGSWVVSAEGRGAVERVTLTDGRQQWTVACDLLACAFHLVPNLELPKLLRCRIDGGSVGVDAYQQSSIQNVACIGELTGIGGLEKALVEGQIAGHAAAGRLRDAKRLMYAQRKLQRFAAAMERAFALRPELRTLATAETLVCRCEDVPYSAVAEHAGWRAAKLHTRCGMGPCQGRICGTATEFLFGWDTTASRPPVFPASVGTVATALDEETVAP
jgi:NADPH-dependent 2,4-dienoyl-CoA reductase/sulfur reductase-like enzyme